MSGRRSLAIGDLGTVVTGSTPPKKQADWFGDEVDFITPTDLSTDGRRPSPVRGLSTAGVENLRTRLLPPGTICFTCIASIGKMCLTAAPAITNQQINSIIVDPDVADAGFVFYLLRNEVRRISAFASGAATPIINKTTFSAIEVELPPLPVQAVIAEILGSIDDLIENNRRQIEILEEMAQAIYREWFVHFRFPGHETATFIDSPIGPIPENWEFQTLEQLAHLTMGQSPKSEFYNESGEGHPFHQGVKDFGPHFPTHRTFCTVEGRQAKSGDILISVRAPVGRLNIAPSDLTIGRGLAAARARSGAQALLFYGLKMTAFAVEDSIGSGTIFKAITKSDLANLRIPWPTSEIESQASSVLDSMMDQIRALTSWNTGLSSTRELLLPKLVSGEIDVSDLDLDAVLEGAV